MVTYARAPRPEVALFLPHLREIVKEVLASEGWEFVSEADLALRARLDPDERYVIEIQITGRVEGRILGKWVPANVALASAGAQCVMQFQLVELTFKNLQQGQLCLRPLGMIPARPAVQVGELRPPPDALPMAREREHRSIQI